MRLDSRLRGKDECALRGKDEKRGFRRGARYWLDSRLRGNDERDVDTTNWRGNDERDVDTTKWSRE
jgi:hypothetical protein